MPTTLRGLYENRLRDWPIWCRAAYPWLLRAKTQENHAAVVDRPLFDSNSGSRERNGERRHAIGIFGTSNVFQASSETSTSTSVSSATSSENDSDKELSVACDKVNNTSAVTTKVITPIIPRLIDHKRLALRDSQTQTLVKRAGDRKPVTNLCDIPIGPLINDQTMDDPLTKCYLRGRFRHSHGALEMQLTPRRNLSAHTVICEP